MKPTNFKMQIIDKIINENNSKPEITACVIIVRAPQLSYTFKYSTASWDKESVWPLIFFLCACVWGEGWGGGGGCFINNPHPHHFMKQANKEINFNKNILKQIINCNT